MFRCSMAPTPGTSSTSTWRPASHWARLEKGLSQRVQALNLFLKDVYGRGDILRAGIIPANRVLGNAQFRKEMLEGWLAAQKLPHVLELWKAHPSYDAFWRGFDAESAADRVTVNGN